MHTINDLIEAHGVEIDPHLDRQATVPIATGPQRQGDVIVVPAVMANRPTAKATHPVPNDGVAVVRGEAGGNTHLLLRGLGVAEVLVRYDPAPRRDGDLSLGVLAVDDGAVAYLHHLEHGYAGIGPGTYVIRRQREQADQIRIVAD